MLLPKLVGSMEKTSFLLVKLCSPDFAQITRINVWEIFETIIENSIH